MLKNISRLEQKIGERIYHLLCDSDSPLVEVKEALFQFTKYVGSIEDAVKAQEEQKKAEEAKPLEPEVKEEPKQE
jgi:hypothetical protein